MRPGSRPLHGGFAFIRYRLAHASGVNAIGPCGAHLLAKMNTLVGDARLVIERTESMSLGPTLYKLSNEV